MNRILSNTIVVRIADIVSSGLGIGFLPVPARATLASAVACAAFWFMPFEGTSLWMLLLVGSASVFGVWSSGRTLRLGESDPKRVVIDEWAGMWLSLAFLPKAWFLVVSAFVLFRAFDVLKPIGISKLENLRGGWGIVGDDLGAGALACAILNLCWWSYVLVFT